MLSLQNVLAATVFLNNFKNSFAIHEQRNLLTSVYFHPMRFSMVADVGQKTI